MILHRNVREEMEYAKDGKTNSGLNLEMKRTSPFSVVVVMMMVVVVVMTRTTATTTITMMTYLLRSFLLSFLPWSSIQQNLLQTFQICKQFVTTFILQNTTEACLVRYACSCTVQ
jgi:hypothetical protein